MEQEIPASNRQMKNYLLTLSILAIASLQANGIANESDSAPRKAAKETQSESSDAVEFLGIRKQRIFLAQEER